MARRIAVMILRLHAATVAELEMCLALLAEVLAMKCAWPVPVGAIVVIAAEAVTVLAQTVAEAVTVLAQTVAEAVTVLAQTVAEAVTVLAQTAAEAVTVLAQTAAEAVTAHARFVRVLECAPCAVEMGMTAEGPDRAWTVLALELVTIVAEAEWKPACAPHAAEAE
jgi:hypothetical protein